VDGRFGAVDEASANKASIERRISTVLPAQRASAEAALAEAQVALDKSVVRAGVDGRVEQFVLQPGDIINPLLRPAGILVPQGAGRKAILAGFDQLGGQVLRPGMAAEAVCATQPFTIIPMVVTEVQDVIAAGQFRPTDQLVDVVQTARPGTITAFLEPLYTDGLSGVPRGGSCIANAYTNNHDELASGKVGAMRGLFLHMVDTVGIVHALILRIQALMLPVQTLVLSGH
jgi:hypothetical protein